MHSPNEDTFRRDPCKTGQLRSAAANGPIIPKTATGNLRNGKETHARRHLPSADAIEFVQATFAGLGLKLGQHLAAGRSRPYLRQFPYLPSLLSYSSVCSDKSIM